MSTRIGTNMAECPEYATELPEFATESFVFGQIWTRIIAESRKHDFPGGEWTTMQELHQSRILPNKFGPILREYGLNRKDSVDSELIRL